MKKKFTSIKEELKLLGYGETLVVLSKQKKGYLLFVGDVTANFVYNLNDNNITDLKKVIDLWEIGNKTRNYFAEKTISLFKENETLFLLQIENNTFSITINELNKIIELIYKIK